MFDRKCRCRTIVHTKYFVTTFRSCFDCCSFSVKIQDDGSFHFGKDFSHLDEKYQCQIFTLFQLMLYFHIQNYPKKYGGRYMVIRYHLGEVGVVFIGA